MEAIIRENWQLVVDKAVAQRKKCRASQQELASMAGVSQSTVSRLENGERNIELEHVLQILFQLGIRLKF